MRHTVKRCPTLFVVLVLLGSLLAPSSGVHAQTPVAPADASEATFEPGPCLWELPRHLDDGQAIACGFVSVPLFHSRPGGETIRLAVGVIEPERGEAEGEPLIMLNGGPGGDSGPLVQLFAPSFLASYDDARDGREIVVFDQRGTGFSEPGLYCEGDIDPTSGDVIGDDDQPVDMGGQSEEVYEREGAECATALGRTTDLTAFTTTESAQDVNDIRVALGYDQVDLWGQSYGTRLALEAMRLYQDEVIRAVVLESVLPPDRAFLATVAVGFDDALVRLASVCANDRQCGEAYPDVLGDFERAVDRFNAQPFDATFEDALSGEASDVTIDGTVISYLVYQLVFSGILVGIVPDLVHSLAGGDPTALDQYLTFLSSTPVATGFYYSVLCQDELAFETLAGTAERIREAGVLPVVADDRVGFGSEDYFAVCRGFDLPASDPVQSEPVTSEIPTLIVSGEYDPITPPSNGDVAAATLPNGQIVVASALGHTPIAFSQRCLLAGTVAFLDDPSDTVDFSCASDLEVEFLTP